MAPASKNEVITDLSQLLADSYVLQTKLQNFHWNVTGPHFHSLHKFFQDQYEELQESIDEIAEQIRALQAFPPSSLKEFLAISQVNEVEQILSAEEMIKQTVQDHEFISANLRVYIQRASDAGDEGSADLLTARLRSHDKSAWMARSHSKQGRLSAV